MCITCLCAYATSIYLSRDDRSNKRRTKKNKSSFIGCEDGAGTRNFGVVLQLTETNLIAVTIPDIDLSESSKQPAIQVK